MRKYFQYLWKTIKGIFVKQGQQITKEDKQEFKEQRVDGMKQDARNIISPVITAFEFYDIPDNKVNAVVNYAVEFVAKNWKTMSYQRMTRKVAEHFKLQLKKDAFKKPEELTAKVIKLNGKKVS